MTEIYISDDLLDLYPKTVLAVTVQKIEIADLRGRNVNYSNSVKAPWTENNARIFGYAYNEQSDTSVPYTQQTCRIIQNGVTLPLTICIIVKAEKKEFTLTFYEDLLDFFLTVNEQSINDVVPIPASAWDAAGIDAARTNTTGIFSALVNWGKSTSIAGIIYYDDYFLPCFYYHTYISGILDSTGLTVSGSILTDDDYLDLVIPYYGETFKYPETYVNLFKIDYDGTGSGGGAGWGNITLHTFATFTAALSVDFRVSADYSSIVWSGGTTIGTYWLELYRTRSAVTTLIYSTAGVSEIVYANTSGTITGERLAESVLDGDVFFWVTKATSNGPVLGNSYSVSYNVNNNPLTEINRSMVSWSLLLPPILCRDLLSDFFNRFGIIPKQIESTLYLKTIDEIISDRSGSVDWSSKLVNPDNYLIGYETNYAQANYFSYQKSVDVSDPNLGRGSIDIANTNLDNSLTLFESVFSNSLTEVVVVGYNIAKIVVYDSASTGIDTFAEKPGLRLLTLRDRTTEDAVTFDATPRTDYRVGYFVDPSQTKDTGFEYFIGQHYGGLERSLQKNKIIDKYFLLTDYDISIFDPHLMIWDGNAYYIVNKISNFVSGRVTKVELFKTS